MNNFNKCPFKDCGLVPKDRYLSWLHCVWVHERIPSVGKWREADLPGEGWKVPSKDMVIGTR